MFAVVLGSAAVVVVASLLCIAFFFVHATAFGIAALSVDLQLFLGLLQCCEICSKLVYCSGAVGSVADLTIAGVS